MKRQKLFVAKCRCGCGMWAAFATRYPTVDEHGRYQQLGMYAETWRQTVALAIRWTTGREEQGASDSAQAYADRMPSLNKQQREDEG